MFSRGDLAAGDGSGTAGGASPSPTDRNKSSHTQGEKPWGTPARIRTGSVSPAKPGAEGNPHRPQFWENQAPVGREQPLTATQILRAGSPVKSDRYGSSVTGSGESGPMDLGGAERSRSPSAASPAILCFLSHRWERNSPPGRRNFPASQRKIAPQGKMPQRQTRILYGGALTRPKASGVVRSLQIQLSQGLQRPLGQLRILVPLFSRKCVSHASGDPVFLNPRAE